MEHRTNPPHGTRRRRDAGQSARGSREVILDAATDLMAERGFAATSIGSICSATGLAPTALYWHFGSKDGLLAAIVERSIRRWYAELVQAMGGRLDDDDAGGTDPAGGTSGAAVPPAADLVRFFAVMADAYRHQPQALRLMLWLGLDRGHPDPEVRAAVQRAREQAVTLIASSIGSALGGGDAAVTAHDRLARLVLVHLDGIFVAHEVDDDEDRLDELFELAGVALVAAGVELYRRAGVLDPDPPTPPAPPTPSRKGGRQ